MVLWWDIKTETPNIEYYDILQHAADRTINQKWTKLIRKSAPIFLNNGEQNLTKFFLIQMKFNRLYYGHTELPFKLWTFGIWGKIMNYKHFMKNITYSTDMDACKPFIITKCSYENYAENKNYVWKKKSFKRRIHFARAKNCILFCNLIHISIVCGIY